MLGLNAVKGTKNKRFNVFGIKIKFLKIDFQNHLPKTATPGKPSGAHRSEVEEEEFAAIPHCPIDIPLTEGSFI
jgi:hypothetical protein